MDVKSLGGLNLNKFNNRLMEPAVLWHLEGLFLRDDAQFSINVFASIGLDGLTNALRECCRANPTHL
ncbi:unnamed protein product [Rotaria magnacalcarata]|uniref:Uncharacterized protein n=1 Tax=Rotaria magnacalcarata TaxID=392030 RepID=A0A8S2QR48_9BILA|nr:unnamed protein product [Rotaria magnacalcarata]CAF4120609.1 unnamed protein product [Rotaria magnacalcarata]